VRFCAIGNIRPYRALFELLEKALRHRDEMVNLEAARAICGLKGVTSKELFPAISGTFDRFSRFPFVIST
jgi:hypothetical protein